VATELFDELEESLDQTAFSAEYFSMLLGGKSLEYTATNVSCSQALTSGHSPGSGHRLRADGRRRHDPER
jgi:hypothetical protein